MFKEGKERKTNRHLHESEFNLISNQESANLHRKWSEVKSLSRVRLFAPHHKEKPQYAHQN